MVDLRPGSPAGPPTDVRREISVHSRASASRAKLASDAREPAVGTPTGEKGNPLGAS
jgi:hypothetical protein